MKIAYETDLNVPMQTAWNILVDFPRYPEWNPVFTAVEGEATLDSHLKTTVKFSGIPPRPIEFRVTACTAPKYFSFETHHRWGEWFLREEWIFRMKERGEGVQFIAEVYVTGLGLRFRRSKMEDAYQRSAANLALALKERIETGISA
ncbi:MAG TPA: hypothetical protein DCQ83_02760 [Fibrobacteres bacterium]|mgnify:CR=1 FL=1|jgi:hypothetical protein|nr:hypothetical protein [Fibrobacterota bacterium]